MSSTQFINKVPETYASPVPTKVQAVGDGDRRFLMADNPETITASVFADGNMKVFAQDSSVAPNGVVKYRVLIWALNQTGGYLRLGITVGNASGDTYNIQNFKAEAYETSGDYLMNVGLPLAKAFIGGTFDMDTTPVDATVPGNKVKLIHETTVTNGKLKGFMCEFDIVNPTGNPLAYKVRVAATNSSTTDLRTTQSAPVAISGPHPRGAWAQADARTADIEYVLGSGDANYSLANGDAVNGDNIYTAAASYDPANAVGNPGQYGVKRLFKITVKNQGDVAQTGRFYVNARGGLFVGAIKINGSVFGIPTIDPSGVNCCPFAQYTLQPGEEKVMDIEVTMGGGASSAYALLLTTKV